MNKSDLVRHVAEEAGTTGSAAEAAVNATLSRVAASLARGEAVSPLGFGTFGTRNRPARTGRNPRTGESLEIRRFDRGDLQGRQAVAGCRERRRVVIGKTGDRGRVGTGGAAC